MNEKKKKKIKKTTILKIAFLIFIVFVVVYTFRNLWDRVFFEIVHTPISVIVVICISALLYEVAEGWVLTTLARVYNPEFSLLSGIGCALYCCFYRLASAGTGTGLAAVFYLSDRGVEYSKATGMYTLEYVFHRVSMAIFCLLFIAVNLPFMIRYYSEYGGLLIAGFLLTAALSVLLLFICLSKRAHRMIHKLVARINRKGKIDRYVDYINNEIELFEMGSRDLFGNKVRIVTIIAQNMLKLFFWCVIPYLILQGNPDYQYNISQYLAVTSLCLIISAVIPALGGIGSTDFAFIMLFSVIVQPGVAGSVAILYRFATFVFLFVVGIFVAIPQRRKHKPLFVKEEIRKY
ncbi:MAG: flippase-like domain-containing protein [Lachnospiraceae bacterium]|nr:flippase-like domain-containing protein [Lachnospiraceae bacterium]